MTVTDPFAPLTAAMAGYIFGQRQDHAEAERRFQRLKDQFALLLQDARYQAILRDYGEVLGEQLRQLVQETIDGKDARSRALRIEFLQQIVAEPLQTAWVEAHRPSERPAVDLDEALDALAANGRD